MAFMVTTSRRTVLLAQGIKERSAEDRKLLISSTTQEKVKLQTDRVGSLSGPFADIGDCKAASCRWWSTSSLFPWKLAEEERHGFPG